MNQEDQLFEDSEYLFMIQLFNIKLERFTERGYLKLLPFEIIEVKLLRSKYQFIYIIIPFIINEQESSHLLPFSAPQPSLIEFNFRTSNKINHMNVNYLISLLIRNFEMQNYLIQ